MPISQISATGTAAAVARPARDTRSYWRVLLAIVAPLPLLGLGASYVISQIPSNGPFKSLAAAAAAHHQSTVVAGALGLFFLIGLIPATIALAWCTRRNAPTLTAFGASISMLGFVAALPLLPNDNGLALVTADKHLNVSTIAALDKALWAQPVNQVASILFLSGIVIGLPLLGIALWRGRMAGVDGRMPDSRRLHPPVHSQPHRSGHRAMARRHWLHRGHQSAAAHVQRRVRPAAGPADEDGMTPRTRPSTPVTARSAHQDDP